MLLALHNHCILGAFYCSFDLHLPVQRVGLESGWHGYGASIDDVQLFVSLHRSTIIDCEEDGIVALDQSNIRLETCTVSGCKGPAVDLTNQARLQARKCTFTECVGEF